MYMDGLDAATQALEGLKAAGLDPATFGPMSATLASPNLKTLHPRLLDWIAPVVDAIASYSNPRRDRRNTWLAPALHGLASAYTGQREQDARLIAEQNAAELQRVAEQNRSALAGANANRSAFGKAVRAQTVDGALQTPAQIEAGKVSAAATKQAAVSKAAREGTNAANREAGVPPVGKPRPRAPKTPKPPKPPTDAQTRRAYVAGIVRDLRSHGVSNKFELDGWLNQKGVMDTLASHGIRPSDIYPDFPQ